MIGIDCIQECCCERSTHKSPSYCAFPLLLAPPCRQKRGGDWEGMLEKCGVEEGEALEGERVCGVEWSGGGEMGKKEERTA